jgi:hypothetical protein
MFIEELEDQWICSCGNWVDKEFNWCPDCCEEQLKSIHEVGQKKESNIQDAP